MSDAITLDVLSSSPVQLDVGDADPIAREEIAALTTRVTTVEGDVSGLSTRMGAVEGDVTALDGRMDAAEGAISTLESDVATLESDVTALGTTVDGIGVRVEAIEADYVTSEDVMGALGGEAPTLVSGSSRAMLGDPETASWMERTTAADGAALIESVKGNTLRWNQLCNLNVTQNTTGLTVVDNGDGSVTVSGTSSVSEEYAHISMSVIPRTSGHKYLIMGCPAGGSASTYYMGVNTSQTDLGSGGIYTSGTTGNAMLRLEVRASGITFENSVITPQVFDLTTIFGAGNEPPTVAEFEALFPEPYYPYDAGSLLPVRMEGIETVAADESWSSTRTIPAATYFPQGLRSAGTVRDELTETQAITRVASVDLGTLTWTYIDTHRYYSDSIASDALLPANTVVMPYITAAKYRIEPAKISLDTNTDVLTMLVNSTPGRLMVYAESADAPKPSGLLFYAVTTPTVTTIDPPLPLSYRTGAGGTERVMVASGTTSAPPVFATRYPLDPAELAASIAPVDGPIAKTNHAVGELVMLGFTLCKVTTAIATGETIAIGTNVTRTTVAAEIAALS